MSGGDSVVAERLDAARTGARETVAVPGEPTEWARSGHAGQITLVDEAAGGEAYRR